MIRVTVLDTETGETETEEIADDYMVICAGSCYVAETQIYGAGATHRLMIKGRLTTRLEGV